MIGSNPPISTPSVPNPALMLDQARASLIQGIRRSGDWFYWIAGLSVINSLAALVSSNFSFVLGLGSTQFIDGVASFLLEDASAQAVPVIYGVSYAIQLFIVGLFVVFGIFAIKGHSWAFIVGMVLYTLDGLIFVWVGDWLGAAFHLFVLWQLFTGIRKVFKLKKLNDAVLGSTNFTPA
jgi:hypothetical protein